MKVSDFVADYLAGRGVTHVYYLIGGMITHLVDSMHRRGNPRLVTMHHEQAAAFAAEGMARMTGVPGVAMGTSGPGAVNLLTGIGSCYFDATPAVFITGQVNRHELRGNRAIRQQGFQETDIVSMARPITKAAWLVTEPERVPEILARAFDLALEGRPGPVLIDLPMDVQRCDIDPSAGSLAASEEKVPAIDTAAILHDLATARAPLLLAGGGIRASRSTNAFRQLAEKLQIPVVHSLQGVDLLPFGHPLRVGMIGTYGNRWANTALGKADVLLVLGSRLDIRQTGSDAAGFRAGKVIHQVDVDPGEMNNRVTGTHAHGGNLPEAMQALLAATGGPLPDRAAWVQEIAALRERWPDTAELKGIVGINPNVAMHRLSSRFQAASGYVADVGNHQMWAAQSLDLSKDQRFLTSAGMGSMGFALPAAVGVALARPDAPVVVVVGDGGMQCNIQELQTIVRNRLNVKTVVMDNSSLGMVRQFQESYFGERFEGTQWGYSAPDFAKVAEAYGVVARTVRTQAEADAAFDWLARSSGPGLVRVQLAPETNAYPKLAFGKPITEMEPLAKPMEMESSQR